MGYEDELPSLYGDSLEDQRELQDLRKILQLIEVKLQGRYELLGTIAKGGAGVVLKVKDSNLGVVRALKCARPSQGKEPILVKILASEISKLREMSHQNLVTLFYSDAVEQGDREWPYYIMEYVEEGQDFYKYLQKTK